MIFFSDYEVEILGTIEGQFIHMDDKTYKIQRAENDGYYVKEINILKGE